MAPSVFDQPVLPTRTGVQRTAELSRILSLPRRKLDIEVGSIEIEVRPGVLEDVPIPDLTPLYLKLGGPCAEYPRCPICSSGQNDAARLWPAQSAALLEAERGWGLFGPMGVGSGKTLTTLLLPDVFGSERAVLLVPAALRNQLLTRDMAAYGRHFHLPLDRIKVVAYTELSDAKTADVLEKIKPDLIIADEAHAIARISAARTKRFVRFMKANPGTRFCALSGTVTKRSLRDYAALAELALRAGSPVPGNWSDLNDWADALDPTSNPIPIGALKAFAEGDPRLEWGVDAAREAAREGYRRRLVETTGVVATSESWEGASLVVEAVAPEIPRVVDDVLDHLKLSWEIGGEEIDSPVRLVEIARQVAVGFYYRWVWPDGAPDVEWLSARAAWHRQVRQVLQNSRAGMDSPLLVSRAAAKGLLGQEAAEAWAVWKPLSKRYNPTPPVEAVWISKFAIEAACKLAVEQNAPVIIWYSRQAVGNALEEFGVPVYGAGRDAGEADPNRESVIACSIASQGTGKNLQRYHNNLVIEPPASGSMWEQLMGRTHRPGQQADEVMFKVFAHTGELMGALFRAVSDAQYVLQSTGQRQKILRVQRIGW